ncbi:MAG: chorismate mutase [Dehalococcoidia bacterium]|tara:strand:+ start:7851 stop:8243 length:393 start_codon:yes stop_codon:yes gene_type:complete
MIKYIKNIISVFKSDNILSVRGATTISSDSKNEVEDKTTNLLNTIIDSNNINKNNILFIIFSTTDDIKSYYPATVARTKLNLNNTALFSTEEPNINGSLKNCIRILLVYKDSNNKLPKYIYQEGAKNLRN